MWRKTVWHLRALRDSLPIPAGISLKVKNEIQCLPIFKLHLTYISSYRSLCTCRLECECECVCVARSSSKEKKSSNNYRTITITYSRPPAGWKNERGTPVWVWKQFPHPNTPLPVWIHLQSCQKEKVTVSLGCVIGFFCFVVVVFTIFVTILSFCHVSGLCGVCVLTPSSHYQHIPCMTHTELAERR